MCSHDAARKLVRLQNVEVEGGVVVLQDSLQAAAHSLQLQQLRHAIWMIIRPPPVRQQPAAAVAEEDVTESMLNIDLWKLKYRPGLLPEADILHTGSSQHYLCAARSF